MSSRSRGFTIIELLVVIAIIGILSSVVLASLGSARTKSRDARRLEDIRQIKIALELYYGTSNANSYPPHVSNRVPAAALAPHMAAVPVDPRTGAGYFYTSLSAGSGVCNAAPCPSYVLGAHMEGVVPEGDIDGTFPVFSCADSGPGTSQNMYCVRP